MTPRTVAEVAALAGGRTTGAAALVGPDVVIDSRRVTPGALFVALVGEHADGHGFVGAALGAGAAAALVSRPVYGVGEERLIVVPDVLAGLSRLARGLIDEAVPGGLVTIGITGSSGKTSVKDLLAQVLAGAGPTVAPLGSFNNEIGVPLTATGIGAETRFLVSEMGARGIGHIAHLCRIVPPRVAVVLNVGHAHAGEFGGPDNTARAKGELVEALGRGAAATGRFAVLNADDHRVAAMADRSDAPVIRFSDVRDPGGDRAVWAGDAEPDDLGRHAFTLHLRSDTGPASAGRVRLRLAGRHQVANAAAAAAAALACGLEADAIVAGLCAARPVSHWRMELVELAGGGLLVNDAYNANPESVAAALDTVGLIMERRGARAVAVLGDMLELGGDAPSAHQAVGAAVADHGIAVLVAVGRFAGDLAAGARSRGLPDRAIRVVADAVAAAAATAELVTPGDVVLVKASRGVGLELVASRLASADPT